MKNLSWQFVLQGEQVPNAGYISGGTFADSRAYRGPWKDFEKCVFVPDASGKKDAL